MGNRTKEDARAKRKRRIRERVFGTPERPRLCVFNSNKHVYAQIVDDTVGQTLTSASSLSKEFGPGGGKSGSNKKGAEIVGSLISLRAQEKGIKKVVFDRNGYLYHGRVEALANAARSKGLEF